MDKLRIVNYCLERNILVSPSFFDKEIDFEDFLNKLGDLKVNVFDSNLVEKIYEIKETKVIEVPQEIIDLKQGKVTVLWDYQENLKQKEVKDFVMHFKGRYESLKKILMSRSELRDSVSISRLSSKNKGEKVSIIGLVSEIRKTKNNNYLVKLEDITGITTVLFSVNKKEILDIAETLVLDEVLGVAGNVGDKIVFANEVYLPEVPISNELKKCPDDVYAVFTGDIHLGTQLFQGADFMKFIRWLRGDFGNEEQREIASKVKYLLISGDLVEGVGIYPGQEDELDIKDIKLQYDELAKYFALIPKHIKIVACGGNHDAMRIAEPQPIFDRKYAGALHELSNFIPVTNPSIINIHSSDNFPGFDVLFYHGFSFPYYADNVSKIRSNGGMDRADLIMKFLLQRRHLCPTHTANLYVPDSRGDPLVIEKVPDFFLTGHIHKLTVSNYRNITMINAGCWDTQSPEQERRGIHPDTCKVPVVNLKTRKVKILNFLEKELIDKDSAQIGVANGS